MNIWFNHNFSSTALLIRHLKAEGGYHIVASHKRADAVMLSEADAALVEPATDGGVEAYLEWALEVCETNQIDVLVPERRKLELTQQRARFEAAGTLLLVAAEPEVLALAHDKAALYAALPPGLVNIPPYRVVRTAAELGEALRDLEYAPGDLEPKLCIKPVEGIFGSGFRTLGETSLAHLLSNSLRISPQHLEDFLSQAEASGEEPTPLLIMRFLAGAERSVDCLAHRGDLVRCVVRRKGEGASQVLEENPAIVEMAAGLTRALRLTGVYNIQFLDDDTGVPYLLEINARASGGLPMAMQSGLNFYHWAVQLLAGRCNPDDVPQPRTGLRVAMGGAALTLSVDGVGRG